MKKILRSFLSSFLALALFSAQALAYTSNTPTVNSDETVAVSDFNEAEIYDAFNEVENLVNTIEENQDLTYADLEAENSNLIANVSSSAAVAMNAAYADAPPFISAFLWGCLFNLAGMLVVGITTDFDNDQLRSSAWGCLINTLLGGGFWGLLGS